MPNAEIIQISRIQNTWLWGKYVSHKKRLDLKNNGNVNEKELFHGTSNNNPALIYDSEDGFDMRYSAQGMWGVANYFAVNASYSNGYAHHTPNGYKEMFLVKVLTGDSYDCQPDSSLRMPPVKQSGSSNGKVQLGKMKYDTVTGNTHGSRVYMTYDNDKAYPTYLIEYSESGKVQLSKMKYNTATGNTGGIRSCASPINFVGVQLDMDLDTLMTYYD